MGSTPTRPTNLFLFYLSTMSVFDCFKSILPQPHGFMDEDGLYNVGLTWIDQDGLTDVHNVQLRYVRNSERLAVQHGKPQPDGSWAYTEANGVTHTMSAERVKAFMEKTQEQATLMCSMLDRLQESGLVGPMVDATAGPATI